MFYFAWVDKSETTFGVEHHVNDEAVFGFSLTQAEGDFAALDVDIINPDIGLLAPSRKQWAWLSWRKPDTTVVPLFFGRLIGVPQSLQDTVVRLNFIARPVDFEDQKAALADSMRVYPWYSPVWLSDDDLLDPDKVLEGYSKLWHVDRITGVVTASDIISGEDGTITFADDEVFYDGVDVSYSESPARKCIVDATVNWDQRGGGSIDITQQLIAAFAEGSTSGLTNVNGDPMPDEGMVSIVAGDSMVDNWPQPGTDIGGNWSVGTSHAECVGNPPLPPTLIQGPAAYDAVKNWQAFPGSAAALGSLFARSPGFVVEIENHTQPWADAGYLAHGSVDILWVPIWRIAVTMVLNWQASRPRTEVLSFEVDADVQPLLTDPGEDEIIRLSYGPVDVDAYIGSVTRPRFFNTTDGGGALESLLARARAALLARARAIDVAFDVPFESAIPLTCRKNAAFFDARIPGGGAAGKVKSYTLSADGDSGLLLGSVVIGCTIGRDGDIEEVEGTPVYVDGYVDGYQVYAGAVLIPTGGDIGYTLAGDYAIEDDGVNLAYIDRLTYLSSITVDGSLDEQQSALDGEVAVTGTDAIDKASGFTTSVGVNLRPILNTAFTSNVLPVVTELKVPRTINLESEGTT